MENETFKVSLVGRSNVGKTTMYNWLCKKNTIVTEEPGTTRDRKYGAVQGPRGPFCLIDTPGVDFLGDVMGQISIDQTTKAVKESSLVLFVVDVRAGLSPIDADIAKLLRKLNKPVLVVVNKCDTEKFAYEAHAFSRLWSAELICVSGGQGTGFAALIERVAEFMPPLAEKAEEVVVEDFEFIDDGSEQDETFGDEEAPEEIVNGPVAIAIVGRPNVGKSSLVNCLLEEERLAVSSIAGTTRDSIDSLLEYNGQKYKVIDTAGIRRHRSVETEIEKKSVSSSLGSMDHCDVALLVIDAVEGLTEQDLKIASFLQKKAKGAVVVVNKWDLMAKGTEERQKFVDEIDRKMPFLNYAPKIFVSAETGFNVFKILKMAQDVAHECRRRISTGEINRWLAKVVASHEPPVVKGRRIKFYYGAQVLASPPTFMLKCNDPQGVHFSYKRFMINRLRTDFGFGGAPLRILFREK